jgi:hypothetical protein
VASITAPDAGAIGIGAQIENFRLQQDLLEQLVYPGPFFAEIGVASTVPPNSSSTTLCDNRSCLTFCTLAAGRSILLIATISGTPAFLAWLIASTVWA